MSNTVAARKPSVRPQKPPPSHASTSPAPPSGALYSASGARKYLTRDERRRVLTVAGEAPTDAELLLLTLAWTGARVSEVLALTALSFQLDASIVAIRTLKRRRATIREVPVPPSLMAALDAQFGLAAAQRDGLPTRLWCCRRETAWRWIKAAMAAHGVIGRHASPHGLRHSFGVGTLQAGVPLTLVQRWLGHARLTTTAIYAEVSGPEERGFAQGFQHWGEPATSSADVVLGTAAIAKLLIAASIADYPSRCACPYQTDRGGRSCGRRRAYSRPGGFAPLCYAHDITPAMVASYRVSR